MQRTFAGAAVYCEAGIPHSVQRPNYGPDNLRMSVLFPLGLRYFILLRTSRPTVRVTKRPVRGVPGVKRTVGEADRSPPISAEVEKSGALPPQLHTYSWCGASN
jgi:hypothetical protein